MKDCKIIRVLNRKGDELLFNLENPSQAMNEYYEYIKVAQEFFDWAFLSDEQKEERQTSQQNQKSVIDNEMERIQRTMMIINGE